MLNPRGHHDDGCGRSGAPVAAELNQIKGYQRRDNRSGAQLPDSSARESQNNQPNSASCSGMRDSPTRGDVRGVQFNFADHDDGNHGPDWIRVSKGPKYDPYSDHADCNSQSVPHADWLTMRQRKMSEPPATVAG